MTAEPCRSCHFPLEGCEARDAVGYGRCCRACTHPSAPWPPPPSDSDDFQTVLVLAGSKATRSQLRRVQLWDRPVLIDADGRVWCRRCLELHTVDELLADPASPHAVELRPIPSPSHHNNSGGQP